MPFLNFSAKNIGVGAPVRAAYDGAAITPSDSIDVPTGPGGAAQTPCVGVYVTTAGNVAVNLRGGGTATQTGLVAGQFVDVAVTRILATGTTATGVFALYASAG